MTRAGTRGLVGRRMSVRTAAVAAIVVAAVALSTVPATGVPSSARRGSGAGRAPSYEVNIRVAIADIQDYWSDAYPDVYGERYVPVPRGRIVAARPGVRIPACQGVRLGYRDIAGNAAYCYGGNFVVYDDVKLFPDLHDAFSPFAVSLVLAHEWGHAVQDRADIGDVATIYKELQADCFAGAWTGDVSNEPQKVAFEAGDLETALAALLEFRDTPGSSPDDPSAHGSAFDRVSAFQEGFLQGPERCAAYMDEPPLVVQLPFGSREEADSGGNVAAEDVIPLTVDLLNDFYAQVEADYRPLTLDDLQKFDSSKPGSIPRCGGGRPAVKDVENRVYFCIDDEYLAFDEPFLQQIYDGIGDFGVAALIANPWATHVQVDQGIPGADENTLEAVLQADCYTGGWSAAFYNGYLSAGSLSAGDLDEFVQAFLVYSRARGVSEDVPITFVRVSFFRRGFFEGYNSCGYPEIAEAVANL